MLDLAATGAAAADGEAAAFVVGRSAREVAPRPGGFSFDWGWLREGGWLVLGS